MFTTSAQCRLVSAYRHAICRAQLYVVQYALMLIVYANGLEMIVLCVH